MKKFLKDQIKKRSGVESFNTETDRDVRKILRQLRRTPTKQEIQFSLQFGFLKYKQSHEMPKFAPLHPFKYKA